MNNNGNGYRIVVDAGHGGNDPGAISGNLKEKDLTLEAANYMYDRFKELGVPVAITRDDDTTLSRAERLSTMTNTFGNDSKVIVLSNHINAGGGEGSEVIYPLRTDSTLPAMILDAIGEEGQIKRKYYQRVLPEDPTKDYYYIMRETPNTTALLIEYGFIDNPNDRRKLQNNLLNYVEAVVRAVCEFIGVPYTKPGETPNIPDNPPGAEGYTYTVKAGDTLYSIARKFNMTVQELKILNDLTSDILSIGQVLRIPNLETPPLVPDNLEEYIVKSGDTLYSISKMFNTTVSELIEFNNLPTTILSIGQILKIPKNEASNIIYVVKAGDTLYQIARNYGVTVDEIKKLNNLTSDILSIGQQLYIPEGTIVEETDYEVYQVKPGDTLYSIAKKYNITPEEIKEKNGLTTNLLTINQLLQIPVNSKTSENRTYIIKAGDTLYQIANNFDVPVSEIIKLNNLTSTNLKIGDMLLIPGEKLDY